MTDLRSAAQQALEALEDMLGWQSLAPQMIQESAKGRAYALRAALAEPENWELRRLREELERCKQVCAATSEAWREEAALAEPVPGQGCDHCNSPLYAAVKCRVCGRVTEPVQQPVYWEVRCNAHPKWMRVDERQFDEYVSHGWEGQKLYAALPQRKPLTEEEIQVAWDSVDMRHPRGNETRIAFARAIERAHGIGGQP